MTTATIETTTRDELLASIGTIPACMRTNYQRVGYMLSMLRGNADEAIAQGAKSLYDGSISRMAKLTRTSTPEAVIAQVLERAQAFQPFPEWVKRLSVIDLPLDLFPDDDPPTSPASAPVPLDYSSYDAWEAEEVGWREFAAHRESILAWVDMRLVEMSEWDDSDDVADWRAA
jgi:hypothetical protein